MLPTIFAQLTGKLIIPTGSTSLLLRQTFKRHFRKCVCLSPAQHYAQKTNNRQQWWITAPHQNVLFYKHFSSSLKKEDFPIKSVEGAEILHNVLEKNKQLLQEKKNVIIQDIRERKDKVKERVEEVIERENVATIPNLLCVGRIIMSPYLGYVIVQSDFSLAMGMLIVAGLTDLADGFIARHWPSQASRLGSFLDPLSDKILVGTLVISMSYVGLLPLWLSGMILFRDVFLIGAGFVIRYISLPQPRTLSRYFDVTHATAQLAPTFTSKINTAVQLATVAFTLGAPIWSYVDHPYLHALWYLTGVTTVAAALSYIINKDTYKILKTQQTKP
ncbi:probable cardiolipin synthase (CMP-forming) [Topomyia yanbarensis]|uniref:probable cardiolipin synthase (CMP-forming) n=1 Tax=Topomyia yanbarensis TaxID=2498891 RepID=UPI00273BAEC4|nr:probable cardiolipin synthase (CMP-forming) [Topomyia yanbarensis]XP_058828528.1 probable cardiolipin synthase (CMP-forming) [Topomyia yanbarensis]XP_058828535.1 probable cardiolipin synthase (CMP-forming) [Topomyia yanbarensis]XP_058828542.1 probable cardiolipin synthase (CMP-forming) [Topomyia yanbarensis]